MRKLEHFDFEISVIFLLRVTEGEGYRTLVDNIKNIDIKSDNSNGVTIPNLLTEVGLEYNFTLGITVSTPDHPSLT